MLLQLNRTFKRLIINKSVFFTKKLTILLFRLNNELLYITAVTSIKV